MAAIPTCHCMFLADDLDHARERIAKGERP